MAWFKKTMSRGLAATNFYGPGGRCCAGYEQRRGRKGQMVGTIAAPADWRPQAPAAVGTFETAKRAAFNLAASLHQQPMAPDARLA